MPDLKTEGGSVFSADFPQIRGRDFEFRWDRQLFFSKLKLFKKKIKTGMINSAILFGALEFV